MPFARYGTPQGAVSLCPLSVPLVLSTPHPADVPKGGAFGAIAFGID